MVRYALLGPIELCDSERRVAVGGPRQVALLALLLINANRALSSDRLIDALWRDLDRARAVKRLHVTIARLRRTLDRQGPVGESVLRTVTGGYVLAVAPGELDVEVFQTRVEEGRRALEASDVRRARDLLGEALGMWRGTALSDVAYEGFAQPEIRRLEELRMSALEARVDCDLGLGGHGVVIGELEALVAAHPGRERLAAQLMLALYRCGRQGDALEVYARTRAYLSGELGLEPGPALRDLQGEILAQAAALQRAGDDPGVAAPSLTEQAGVLPSGVVTFVLTDIEGSTGLWEADGDAMATALQLHDELIARLATRHGGRLLKDKGEGDATLSVFQRASDAVACAAELQRALSTASWPAGLVLRVRVGVHSGEAQERDGDYFGPVLNRAARLRSLASGGVTVLSQSTAELVRDRLPGELALVDVGRHELRGLSRPERVFELRATAAGVAGRDLGVESGPVMLALARPLHAPVGSPFVGRGAELAHLRERWAAVQSGARAAIVIGGEPGIGKTRLAGEFARTVREQGGLVLYGRCDEGLAVPYQPFVEALRPYARVVGLDRVRGQLGDLAAELGCLLPELAALGEPGRSDPESERYALFEAVAALIEAATHQQRVLLVLDDLHWAPCPTLLLLRHLIRSERSLGVLVLCTYRETELDRDDQLARLLADLHRDASVERLSIGGLDEPAIAAMLEARIGHTLHEQPRLVHVLGTQTAGNPFFIGELLAHLAESREHLTAAVTAAQLEVPAGLRYVIAQRVARLSAPSRRALSVAAVAGPTFSFVLLERVLGASCGVLDALDEALSTGLLTDAGDGQHAFAHALVRQTIYTQLGSASRMRLHRQLGEALETIGNTEASVEALAYHFAQAASDGQGVKAARYALAAGRSATARLGYEQAAEHYERGLQALLSSGQPQPQQRLELLLALGEARWGAGEPDTARQTCKQAAELAEQCADATALARAALAYCGPHRFEAAVAVIGPVADLLQRALAALGEDDSALRARVMGRLTVYTAVQQRKPALARQALAIARRVADKATLADVLASTHLVTHGPDALRESLAMARELGQLADELKDPRLRAVAHEWLLNHLLELGDIEAVERELQALQRLTQTRRERYFFTWVLTAFRASHALLRGRLADCETLAHDALTHRYKGYDECAALIHGTQMLFVRAAQGRLDEMVQSVEDFAEHYPQIVASRCGLGWVYAQLGRSTQARQQLDMLARADFSDIPRDLGWLSILSSLAEVVQFLDDGPRARLLYKLLLPYADRYVVIPALLCLGSASRALGLLATTLSRFEDAKRHFEHALTMNAHIKAPIWIAQTEHDYARMLLLRDRPGDRDKALELLKDALAAANKLGLTALTDKTQLLKLMAEAPAPSPALPTRA
jgi:DNA-binding SARP family transcriptional activator/tetratricopeptide (TPR) repeat protein